MLIECIFRSVSIQTGVSFHIAFGFCALDYSGAFFQEPMC
jgi:hypothetical protein